MNTFTRFSLLAIVLLLLACLCGNAAPTAAGCATPADLMKRLSTALKAGDIEEIARCQSAYVRDNPEAARTLAGINRLNPTSRQLVIDGVKKFGAKKFVHALNFYGMMFISQGVGPEAIFDLMLTKGKLTVNGDKATYTYKVGKQGDETLPKQAELAKFQKEVWGGILSTGLNTTLVRVNGRWFLESPESKQIALYGKIYQPFSAYLQQVRQCINSSASAAAFTKAMEKINKDFETAADEVSKEK